MPSKRQTVLASLLAVAATSAEAVDRSLGPRRLVERGYSGQASYYDTETGNAGSCGSYLSNTGWTVAMNSVQYESSMCGRSIVISYGGKTQTATVADECMSCGGYGGIDLTPSLFSSFASQDTGVIEVSWEWADSSSSSAEQTSTSQWKASTTSSTRSWTPSSTSTWRATSTYTKPSSTWTPSSSSTHYSTPSSTWTPSSSSFSSSTTSSYEPSTLHNSTSISASATANATLVSSAIANLTTTTIALDNGTSTTATLAVSGSLTSTLSAALAGSTAGSAYGAISNVNQVVLQMANILVNAAESDDA